MQERALRLSLRTKPLIIFFHIPKAKEASLPQIKAPNGSAYNGSFLLSLRSEPPPLFPFFVLEGGSGGGGGDDYSAAAVAAGFGFKVILRPRPSRG